MTLDIDQKLDKYKVRDIYEAAYLYASGCNFVGLEKSSTFYNFVFSNLGACRILRDEFWQNKGTVVPKLYGDSIKLLKQQIFQADGRQYA